MTLNEKHKTNEQTKTNNWSVIVYAMYVYVGLDFIYFCSILFFILHMCLGVNGDKCDCWCYLWMNDYKNERKKKSIKNSHANDKKLSGPHLTSLLLLVCADNIGIFFGISKNTNENRIEYTRTWLLVIKPHTADAHPAKKKGILKDFFSPDFGICNFWCQFYTVFYLVFAPRPSHLSSFSCAHTYCRQKVFISIEFVFCLRFVISVELIFYLFPAAVNNMCVCVK